MDNTLDSIRTSNNHSQEEMSYLFGRDPSILAYGQRPLPPQDNATKKNLLSLYEVEELDSIEESGSINSDSLQTIKVYLRMKPFPKKVKISEEQEEAYKIINSTTLFTRLPALESSMNCMKRSKSSDIICRRFTFSQTFGPGTTQLELFEKAIMQQMADFLGGQNCTVMTYGTTNSGKSYTLQGTTISPGIIPRALEFVFSKIIPKTTPSYKPIHHCDVISLDPAERVQELEGKTKLLTFCSLDKNHYIHAYKQMQKLLEEECPVRSNECSDAHYSVWVSFAEIYNETVYDLLSNECQKKRQPLKLATDSHGKAFIKGLRNVCVNSGSEAYQVLMAGQYNLKVAATALNAKSSRSHCIFTIKLLKYYIEGVPDSVEVSTFSFCDLAGSERLKKTLNIGERLKEAQNINTSLLVLGRCLKSIHEGQLMKQKTETIGPFRESKLTRLFQRALSGKEHIALIVNINPLPNLYIETQNVLSFSAIAKKIVVEQKEKVQKKSKSRFSQIVTQSIKTVTDWDTTELESVAESQHTDIEADATEFIHPEDYEDLLNENEKLRKEIAALKSASLTRDLQTRQEMVEMYTAMMKELEADWKNRIRDVEEQQEDVLEWSVKQVEEFYKQKLDQLSSRKRIRSCKLDEEDDDDEVQNIEELETENSRLTSKVVKLKNTIKELREANQNLNVEKNKAAFELSIAKEDLKNAKTLLDVVQKDICSNDETTSYTEELKSQLTAKQEHVKKLKQFLNEAKEEYIAITTDAREKEMRLKEQEEIIIDNEDKIEDLEAHLEHANICLAEKTKAVEILEEKLEQQNKRLLAAEKKMGEKQDEINELNNEKMQQLDKIASLENAKTVIENIKCQQPDTFEDATKNNEYEIIIKEEILSDAEVSLHATREQPVKEVGCQADMQTISLEDKDTQTMAINTKEEINQTSFTEKSYEEEAVQTSFIEQFHEEEATQTSFIMEEQFKLEEMTEELLSAKKLQESFAEERNSYQIEIVELKKTIENFQEKLSEDKKIMENKILNYEQQINQKEIKLSSVEDSNKNYLKQLQTAQQDLDNHISKCTREHETKIQELEKVLTSVNDRNDTESQSLSAHDEKILKLEQNLSSITEEFQEKIKELNKSIETCQIEKITLQNMIDERNDKLAKLENRLEEAVEKEREKDSEIIMLQKEMKEMIQTNEIDNRFRTDEIMEKEMKSTIKHLAMTREELLRKEKEVEEKTKVLDLFQQTAQERQVENDRLRFLNEELKNALLGKDREMEVFMKHREETITKYEELIKNQQDELQKQRTKLQKYENQKKKDVEHTSEDEVNQSTRRGKRRGKKEFLSQNQENVAVIDLSDSDSKHSTKRTAFLPPNTRLSESAERKRIMRKKKLFVADEDTAQDIEPLEIIPVTPSPQTRTLRSRRK